MNRTAALLISISSLVILGVILSLTFTPQSSTPTIPGRELKVYPTLRSKSSDTISPTPMSLTIDTAKQYTARLDTTAGPITISLNASATPITVDNFVNLSRKSFYNNTIFHRVMSGFMIQGGDPNGNGTGGPGYKFNDEPFTGDYTRGTVAMANAGPNTNGSQFFIMHKDVLSLPKNYVIFGKVVDGLDTVDKIATAEVKLSASGEMSTPVSPVKINSVTITEE